MPDDLSESYDDGGSRPDLMDLDPYADRRSAIALEGRP